MTGHGPEAEVFEKGSSEPMVARKTDDNSIAFMFETCYLMKLSDYAVNPANLDNDYW
eukprot:CAMPEP_0202961624 /NCGR_PEP_ID=MMETSP1396-20130829/5699_1 /ASSEMBLY_ACC=CAM_ASM_000872 /TAXON_ID= /ORGANISM="Pseudokeronopsis sp., Strain Brazil" /LENGTH=56 /DNA_ID=CAMNT_0049681599 /DNA_START=1 /DNA_END=168 /DNA_ORIENTATION=-